MLFRSVVWRGVSMGILSIKWLFALSVVLLSVPVAASSFDSDFEEKQNAYKVELRARYYF